MILTAKIKEETGKAINAEVYFYIDGQTYTWMMWFPKSRTKVMDDSHIEVEDWLVSKFEKELAEKHSNSRVSTAARIHAISYEF